MTKKTPHINPTFPLTRWMSLKQAREYCNINKKKLIELIHDGKIKGGQHQDKGNADWFIDRFSIDSYMESMTHHNTIQQKADEIIRKLGLK